MKTIFYGGAFDPFHEQHRALIVGAQKELNADRVIVYPSFLPPHKESLGSSFEMRMLMTKEGVKDLPYVVVDPIEKERNKINYSYQIIPLLKERYPSDEFYFLIGADSMVNFEKWVRPDLIANEITLAVAGRTSIEQLNEAIENAQNKFGAHIVCLKVCGKPVSSSMVRARAELGLPQEDLAPSVEQVITRNKLYSTFSNVVKKIKEDIPEKTFQHSCRTVMYALKVNTKLNLPFKKVFLAALLHDCAKHVNTRMEGIPTPVVHQYVGSEMARDIYGIGDEEILSAIRCHTTGKPDMTTLDKLIFCSDMLEEGRDYPGVEDLRMAIENDFEKGFLACLKTSYDHVIRSGKEFDPLTKSCVMYYTLL